MQDVQMTKLW